MTSFVVHLVRHGEVHNPGGVLYGRLPGFGLSERGRAMAEVSAKYVASRPVAAVVASPLQRTCESAEPLMAELERQGRGVPLRLDDRVIEAANDFEGLVVADAVKQPQHWWRLRQPFRPSWGEAFADIAARMREVIVELRDDLTADGQSGKEAVIVSHQLPIWATYLSASGKSFLHDPRKRRCALSSVTSLHFASGELIGTTYVDPARDV